jgi:hypothetical protein
MIIMITMLCGVLMMSMSGGAISSIAYHTAVNYWLLINHTSKINSDSISNQQYMSSSTITRSTHSSTTHMEPPWNQQQLYGTTLAERLSSTLDLSS